MHGVDAQLPAAEPPPRLLMTLAERLARTIAVARALILAGRMVDLAGIEDGIGMLCAKALDVPSEQARALLPALYDLRAQVESLTLALRPPGPQ
jgi:hypothetical protein